MDVRSYRKPYLYTKESLDSVNAHTLLSVKSLTIRSRVLQDAVLFFSDFYHQSWMYFLLVVNFDLPRLLIPTLCAV